MAQVFPSLPAGGGIPAPPTNGETTEYIDARLLSEPKTDDKRVEHARHVLHEVGLSLPAPTTAHLKGFTSGLKESEMSAIGPALVSLLQDHGISVLCWDGDDWAADSFTGLLPFLRKQLPSVKFVAFLRSCERFSRYGNPGGFQCSWAYENSLEGLTVMLVDDEVGADDHYEHLGKIALQLTMASLVIAIGGGAVLRKEYELMWCSGAGPQYLLVDAVRVRAGVEEHSALVGLEGVLCHSVQVFAKQGLATEC